MTNKFKRRQVVMEAKVDMFRFYGRVWKIVDEHHVIVIDCGRHVTKYHVDDLIACDDYKGFMSERWWHHEARRKVWIPMTSMRRLKKRARYYNPTLTPRDYRS